MRTLEDLQQSLARRAEAAPDGAGMVERARAGAGRIRRRRRIVQGAATVVAVAAAAVTVPLALRETTPPDPAEAPPPFRSVTELSAAMAPGSDFVIPWRSSAGDREQAQVVHRAAVTAARPDQLTVNEGAGVLVFDPGAYDPAALRRGEPVTVGGRQAWYAPDLPVEEDMSLDGRNAPALTNGPALGWQEPSGAWVVLFRHSVTPAVRADLIEVARDLRVQDPPQPVRAPFRFGWLAPGLRVTGLQLHDSALLSGKSAAVTYGYDSGPAGDVSMTVFAVTGEGDRDWEMIRPALPAPQRVGGHDAWYVDRPNDALAPAEGGSIVVVDTGACHLQLSVADSTRIPEADAMRMAGELTVSDCGDLDTWLPLTE
ncbi:hypothetical protein AB0F72_30220 [Actinoplanes sp. NPDC023936]|uniref:hypothetical protein n=1 Tax=Actinoplanes sp. NPDC023936 TaxID=3154910 RepID=UPI0033D29F12